MDIQTELLNILSDSINKTKKYLNVFEVKDSYLFSVNNEKKTELKKSFMTLSGSLVSISERTDSLTSQIATMVCNADDNMNNELTLYFSNLLENCFLWRKALISFLDNSSIILSKDGELKYSMLISYAQSFLSASESLVGILNLK